MSVPDVVAARSDTRAGSLAWVSAAVAVGIVGPRLIDGWISSVDWLDMPMAYAPLWALVAVLTVFLGLGCTWMVATRGPTSNDRLLDLLLAGMVLALAAFLLFVNIAYPTSQIETVEGDFPVPPGLDRGLITSMGYLAFGLSLAAVLARRGVAVQPRATGALFVTSRRVMAYAAVLLITVAAGYLAWAAYYNKVLQS